MYAFIIQSIDELINNNNNNNNNISLILFYNQEGNNQFKSLRKNFLLSKIKQVY